MQRFALSIASCLTAFFCVVQEWLSLSRKQLFSKGVGVLLCVFEKHYFFSEFFSKTAEPVIIDLCVLTIPSCFMTHSGALGMLLENLKVQSFLFTFIFSSSAFENRSLYLHSQHASLKATKI